jgi:3-oxoacyl-(acyl-carrier-protein) synthase
MLRAAASAAHRRAAAGAAAALRSLASTPTTIVVTGTGAVTPLGATVGATLAALARGAAAPRRPAVEELGDAWAHRADVLTSLPGVATVSDGVLADAVAAGLPPTTPGAARGAARFAALADAAAGQALKQAGLRGDRGARVGAAVGCAFGGFSELAAAGAALGADGGAGLRRCGGEGAVGEAGPRAAPPPTCRPRRPF